MQDFDVLRLERLNRVKTFLESHIGEFAPGSVVDHTRTEVTDLLSTLNAVRSGQLHLSANKEEILASLMARFHDIACTARSILSDDPSFPEEFFRFPDDCSADGAAAHADAILGLLDARHGDTVPILAEKIALRGRFAEYEMDSGFVSALRADRQSLALAVASNGKHPDPVASNGRHPGHGEGPDQADADATLLSQAKADAKAERMKRHVATATLLNQADIAITRLDGPIQNKYSACPERIREWKEATRIHGNHVPLEDHAPPAP